MISSVKKVGNQPSMETLENKHLHITYTWLVKGHLLLHHGTVNNPNENGVTL